MRHAAVEPARSSSFAVIQIAVARNKIKIFNAKQREEVRIIKHLNELKTGGGQQVWNNCLREFEGFLGAFPIKAIVNGNTLTITFPDNVAAISPTPVELDTRIHAGV